MKNFLKKVGSNQKIESGMLSIVWENPWFYLAHARSGDALGYTSGALCAQNAKMWRWRD